MKKRNVDDARLDLWVQFRDKGLTVTEAAREMGCAQGTLREALARARRRGDQRGRIGANGQKRLAEQREKRLNTWAALREKGYSIKDAATELGMRKEALSTLLARARRQGDPRGFTGLQSGQRTEQESIDWDEVLTEWDRIGPYDTFESCARRLGVGQAVLNEVLLAARAAGDPRARHPFLYTRNRKVAS